MRDASECWQSEAPTPIATAGLTHTMGFLEDDIASWRRANAVAPGETDTEMHGFVVACRGMAGANNDLAMLVDG